MSIPVIKRVRGTTLPEGAVYVGRGSRWGNPFPISEAMPREITILQYRQWLMMRPNLVIELALRKPTALACWCAPKACHADVLAEALEAIE